MALEETPARLVLQRNHQQRKPIRAPITRTPTVAPAAIAAVFLLVGVLAGTQTPPSKTASTSHHIYPSSGRRGHRTRAACAQVSLNIVACSGAGKTRTRSIAHCTPLHASRALYCFHAPGLVQCRQEAPLAPAPSHAVRHVAKHMVAAALLLAGPPVNAHKELSGTFLADVGVSAGLAPHNSTGQACVATDVESVYAGIRVNAATGGGPRGSLHVLPREALGAEARAWCRAPQARRATRLQLPVGRHPVSLFSLCAPPVRLCVADGASGVII